MSDDEFMGSLIYYWKERDRIGGFIGYSLENVKRIDPVLADAIERFEIAKATLDRLMKSEDL